MDINQVKFGNYSIGNPQSGVPERNEEKAHLFLDTVYETIERGGTVVIPSFAVGRTQEILYEINQLKDARVDEEFKNKIETIMKTPVYVDSPLAISATEVFKKNVDLFEEVLQEKDKFINVVRKVYI